MGYSGGTLQNPTYHNLGDHTETTEIDYDPAKTPYAELLDVFWQSHNPCERPYSRQYMSAIFVHDDEQKKLAEEAKGREEARRGAKIKTQILPFTGFTLAEDYHQKYSLRQSRTLMKEFRAFYPGDADFVNSTAAARVNGYLGGAGSAERLKADADRLGLSAEAIDELKRLAGVDLIK